MSEENKETFIFIVGWIIIGHIILAIIGLVVGLIFVLVFGNSPSVIWEMALAFVSFPILFLINNPFVGLIILVFMFLSLITG